MPSGRHMSQRLCRGWPWGLSTAWLAGLDTPHALFEQELAASASAGGQLQAGQGWLTALVIASKELSSNGRTGFTFKSCTTYSVRTCTSPKPQQRAKPSTAAPFANTSNKNNKPKQVLAGGG